jgi:hypothetical protein
MLLKNFSSRVWSVADEIVQVQIRIILKRS